MININVNKPFADYVEFRLQEWAEWFSRGNFYGIGYPSSTIEYRLMTEALIFQQKGHKSLHCHHDAEEIESLVCEIRHQNNKMALALRYHYFNYHDYKSTLLISRTQFQNYLGMGRQWIAGRLSAEVRVVDLS